MNRRILGLRDWGQLRARSLLARWLALGCTAWIHFDAFYVVHIGFLSFFIRITSYQRDVVSYFNLLLPKTKNYHFWE